METFSQKWIVVSFLDEVPDGTEFTVADFPLHLTFAGVFATEKTGKQLVQELAALLAKQPAIMIEADSHDHFGPYRNIPVMKLKKKPELLKLYRLIYKWLENLGVAYNSPEYQGDGYQPHVTDQKSGSLKAGKKRTLRSVSLIDMYPDGDGLKRKIVTSLQLK